MQGKTAVMQPTWGKLRDLGWSAAEQAVRLLAGLAATVIIARALEPAGFAAYSYVFVLIALYLPLARFGLDAVVLRQIAAEPDDAGRILGSALVLSTLAALVAAAAALGTVALIGGPPGVSLAVTAIASLVILAVPTEVYSNFLKARERFAIMAAPRIVIAVAIAIAVFLAAQRSDDMRVFVTLRAAEALLFALAAAVAALGFGGMRIAHGLSRSQLSAYARAGLPLTLAGFATLLYMRIDQVMLGQLAPPEELAFYSVAVRIAEVAFLLPAILQTSFYAVIVRSHERDPGGFEGYMGRFYDLSALLALPTMLLLGAAGWLLIVPAFGGEYAASRPILLVLLASTPFYFLYYAWGTMLTVRQWFWSAPLVTVIGAAVNLVLNFPLIARYGAMGAAVATVISYFFASIGGSLFFPHLRSSALRMLRALEPVSATHRLLGLRARGGF
jgi:O-antigen/teichoic acid export membrane protein